MPLLLRLYERGIDGIRVKRPAPDDVGVAKFSELVLADIVPFDFFVFVFLLNDFLLI